MRREKLPASYLGISLRIAGIRGSGLVQKNYTDGKNKPEYKNVRYLGKHKLSNSSIRKCVCNVNLSRHSFLDQFR